jgi:hypothetical protein
MNSKDQLDNNEIEKNHLAWWEDFHDTKIESYLDWLEKKMTIDTLHMDEKGDAKIETIEHITDEVNKIKAEINHKKTTHGEYIPVSSGDESETLERANTGRKSSAQNIKNNIQQYPGRLWSLLKTIDNRW